MSELDTDLRASYAGVRILVFGASGFIGRRVVRMLLDCGALVYPAVRSRTAAPLLATAWPGVCDVLACDLRDQSELHEVFTQVKPAIVFNLAGYGVDPSERDQNTAYAINAHAPGNICRAISGYSVAAWQGLRLVHAGSALEYGTASGDLAEDTTPQPNTLYGCSKLEGTLQLASEALRAGVRACTARLFMVYGPGERPHRLLPSLIRAATTGEALRLTAGLQRRDFVYVDDVAEALLRLGVSAALPGEIVNVATGRLMSIRDFAETAAELLSVPREHIRFGALPTRQEEMWHDPVNITRLRQLTSWSPRIEAADGIRRTALASRSADRKSDKSFNVEAIA